MICSNCGQECADGGKFCTNCGVELAEATVEGVTEEKNEVVAEKEEDTTEVAVVDEVIKAEEVEVEDNADKPVKTKEEKKAEKKAKKEYADADKKPFGKGKLCLAAVAVLLLLFISVALFSGDEAYTVLADKAVSELEWEEDGLYACFVSGDKMKLDDGAVFSETYSLDRSVVSYTNENGELVIIKDGKVIKTGIDDANKVQVSGKGDTLVYYSDCESALYDDARLGYERVTQVGTLNLYYIKKGKTVEVAEEVVVGSAVLSPNGETVAYVAEYDATDDFKGFYSVKGKKEVEVGKEKRVFAIADKGKYVYYADEDRLYVQKKGKEAEKLASGLYEAEVMLNADYTEMLFLNNDKTYITVKAGEKKKVAGQELDFIITADTVVKESRKLDTERGAIYVTNTGVDTFEEKLFYDNYRDDIIYMLSGFEAEKVASDADEYVVAEDGKSLVYIDNYEIVQVTQFAKGGTKKKLTDDAEAVSLYADGDLKYIYFKNLDQELCCLKGSKIKKIADDITSVAVSSDGKYCYYVVDEEELYYSKKAGKGKKLLTEDEGFLFCNREDGNVKITVNEEDLRVVYLMSGKKMEELYRKERKSSEAMIDGLFDNNSYEDLYDSIFGY